MLNVSKKNIEMSVGEEGIEIFALEYRRMDFYGPFVYLNAIKDIKSQELKIYPKKVLIETPEISACDFDLLVEASSEIYKRMGTFELYTDLYVVKVKTENEGEIAELMLNKLKNIQLF